MHAMRRHLYQETSPYRGMTAGEKQFDDDPIRKSQPKPLANASKNQKAH